MRNRNWIVWLFLAGVIGIVILSIVDRQLDEELLNEAERAARLYVRDHYESLCSEHGSLVGGAKAPPGLIGPPGSVTGNYRYVPTKTYTHDYRDREVCTCIWLECIGPSVEVGIFVRFSGDEVEDVFPSIACRRC